MINTPRVKKRKLGKLTKTEEQIAKQKLFEISYLCDEKDIDDSQILIPDHRHFHPIVGFETKLQSEIERTIRKKKSTSFNLINYRTLQPEAQDQPVSRVSLSPHNCIFNTVSSRKVFVGTKLNCKPNHNPCENSIRNLSSTQKKVQTIKISKIQPQSFNEIEKQKLSIINSRRRQIDGIIRKVQRATMRTNFYQTHFSLQKYKLRQMQIKLKDKIGNYIPLSQKFINNI